MKDKFHIPQFLIMVYLFLLMIGVIFLKIPIIPLVNDALIKWAMNGVLVLSLIPMMNVGAGMNFGMSIGISAGLVGMCLAIEWRLQGFFGFFIAILLSVMIAILFGLVYSNILNRLKGNEEIIGTFIGFAFIPLMNFFWTLAPFSNRQMLYPVGGQGLRPKISLSEYFGGILDQSFVLTIGTVKIPVVLLGFYLLIGFFIYLFSKTLKNRYIKIVAENSKFAELSGISPNRNRTFSIILSTCIAAIGICVYSQSYGFVQLYGGSDMMAFPAISALLVGGASRSQATVKHALIGTFLFQTTYLLSVPIANELLIPEMSEIIRMMVTNGVILYAFLYKGSVE